MRSEELFVNKDLWKGVVVAYFKVLLLHMSVETE
jgi:hypothetical protein